MLRNAESHSPKSTASNPKRLRTLQTRCETLTSCTGRAASEACSAKWILGTNWVFAVGLRKGTEYLDTVGRTQDLPDAHWLLACGPDFKYTNTNNSPYMYKRTDVFCMGFGVFFFFFFFFGWVTDDFIGRKWQRLKNLKIRKLNYTFII
jgi:hypothetical protein